MPTTSNFGWTTPADTDLVKDGAAAIRTLGNGIDTSFLDLKGGTSGQILAKNSATDLDFVWVANDQGDITGVTAGTGISGGGTSGAVTITNSMATEITASGDIIVGTGSGTFDNLPIGSTGQVLTADTTVSPYKVKWAAPAGSLTMSEIATGTLSGTQLQISSLTTYDDIWFFVNGVNPSSTCSTNFTINNNGGSNYKTRRLYEIEGTNYPTAYNFNSTSIRVNDALLSGNTENIFWVHFSNCKSAGLTTFEFGFAYRKSAVSAYVSEWGAGYFNVAAAVSTIEMNFGSSVSGGTYVVIAG